MRDYYNSFSPSVVAAMFPIADLAFLNIASIIWNQDFIINKLGETGQREGGAKNNAAVVN